MSYIRGTVQAMQYDYHHDENNAGAGQHDDDNGDQDGNGGPRYVAMLVAPPTIVNCAVE